MSAEQTNTNGQTFEAWYDEANHKCEVICGLTLDDLADGNSYDAWASDTLPGDYAREILVEEGFPFP